MVTATPKASRLVSRHYKQGRPPPHCRHAGSFGEGILTAGKQETADDPQVHATAIDLANWVRRNPGKPSSVVCLGHCSGTPGPPDLPTLAAFATEVHQPSPAVPLSLVVANIIKWRPEILRWFQHTRGDCLIAQETHLSLEQEKQAKPGLVGAGLHSFWAGATESNQTRGGLFGRHSLAPEAGARLLRWSYPEPNGD